MWEPTSNLIILTVGKGGETGRLSEARPGKHLAISMSFVDRLGLEKEHGLLKSEGEFHYYQLAFGKLVSLLGFLYSCC